LPAATAAAEPPAGGAPWAELARADLTFIHDELAANHPGAVDPENESFGRWLEAGYRAALDKADAAESLDDVLAALRFYVAGFADGHTYLSLDYSPRWLRWPGFVASWRPSRSGGRYLVHHAASEWPTELPPVGAELVACDGRPIDRMMTEELLPHRDGRVELEATYVAQAPWLFARGLEKGLPKPERCTARVDGEVRELDLAWRWHRARDLRDRIDEAAQRSTGVGAEVGITETAPGEHWIRLPTFDPRDADLERMEEIVGSVAGLRNARRIVFDVRGNGGGSSVWGSRITEGLFGSEIYRWVGCRHAGEGAWAEWRASEKNLARVEETLPSMREKFGEDSVVYDVYHRLRSDLVRAVEAGDRWVRQPEGDRDEDGSEPSCPETAPENPVAATVVLLTDGACASACLDFADELLLMPGVVHAGAPTSADTVYMEIRDVPLPSRLGRFSCAMKVYRNRSRGHNEPYVPAHRFGGDLADTEALRRWVRTLPRP
jgi:hypothetical protein